MVPVTYRLDASAAQMAKVTDAAKHGSLLAVYYFGAMIGCFTGGGFQDRDGWKLAAVVSNCSLCSLCSRVLCGPVPKTAT